MKFYLYLEKLICAIAAAFIPLLVFGVAHGDQIKAQPGLWIIVVAGLVFSAPSVAQWAMGWTGPNRIGKAKAIGFTALLECVLVFVHAPIYSRSALAILTGINCLVAIAAMRNAKRAFAAPAKRATKRKPKASAVPA